MYFIIVFVKNAHKYGFCALLCGYILCFSTFIVLYSFYLVTIYCNKFLAY